jgi:hypothetical protein
MARACPCSQVQSPRGSCSSTSRRASGCPPCNEPRHRLNPIRRRRGRLHRQSDGTHFGSNPRDTLDRAGACVPPVGNNWRGAAQRQSMRRAEIEPSSTRRLQRQVGFDQRSIPISSVARFRTLGRTGSPRRTASLRSSRGTPATPGGASMPRQPLEHGDLGRGQTDAELIGSGSRSASAKRTGT